MEREDYEARYKARREEHLATRRRARYQAKHQISTTAPDLHYLQRLAEQNGFFERARKVGRLGVGLDPRQPELPVWGHHPGYRMWARFANLDDAEEHQFDTRWIVRSIMARHHLWSGPETYRGAYWFYEHPEGGLI